MDKILEMNLFQGAYRNRRVLLTGHTGFKGSWLLYFLRRLGAIVRGIALEPDTDPSHFDLLFPDKENSPCDILDRIALQRAFDDFQPEIVFHLAAQPLVRRSYRDPAGTFETNVTGTVNLLECCRASSSVRAILVVTSDKCYENRETEHPYAETDPLGGYDPYSASKGCAEIAAACWRRSFFANGPFLATARAGNVIGGGDWAEDRLVPDMMRAAAANRELEIRSPASVRPWQHVLDCLGGYLLPYKQMFAQAVTELKAPDCIYWFTSDDGQEIQRHNSQFQQSSTPELVLSEIFEPTTYHNREHFWTTTAIQKELANHGIKAADIPNLTNLGLAMKKLKWKKNKNNGTWGYYLKLKSAKKGA